MADTQFSIWVTKLSGRVKALQGSVGYRDVHELEREANTCRAELSTLYDYAKLHEIDVAGDYYFPLSSIEADLRDAEYRIKTKKDEAERQQHSQSLSWWKRALVVVTEALGILGELVGLTGISSRIAGSARRLLTDDDG